MFSKVSAISIGLLQYGPCLSIFSWPLLLDKIMMSSDSPFFMLVVHNPSYLMPPPRKIFNLLTTSSYLTQASLVAQLVNNPPAMRETWVRSLVWEDPLEKGKVTHSSILAWIVPWIVESMGSQRVRHDWVTFTFTFISYSSSKCKNTSFFIFLAL